MATCQHFIAFRKPVQFLVEGLVGVINPIQLAFYYWIFYIYKVPTYSVLLTQQLMHHDITQHITDLVTCPYSNNKAQQLQRKHLFSVLLTSRSYTIVTFLIAFLRCLLLIIS